MLIFSVEIIHLPEFVYLLAAVTEPFDRLPKF